MLVTIIGVVHSLRMEFVKEYYASRGYEVENIMIEPDSVQSFFNQLSVSKKIRKSVAQMNPDIVYCEAVFDLLIKELGVLKKKNNNIKLIFDVDSYSTSLHQKHLNQANTLFCSCELYKGYIHGAHVLYPTNGQNCLVSSPELKADELSFCVMHQKNLDMNLMVTFLRECSTKRKCVLHILGNWKQKEAFIQNVLNVGVNVVDHKELTSQSSRQEVFDQCHYGLNLRNSNKIDFECLEYMCGQLPIINSVTSDLESLCELWDIGMNINDKNYKVIAKRVCEETLVEQFEKRKHIRNLYNTYFTRKKFFEVLEEGGNV